MSFSPGIRAACVLIVHPERDLVLAVQRMGDPGRGKWGLPGGLVGHWERPSDAAARELLEETCVLMSKPDAFPLYLGPCPTRGGRKIACVTYHAPVWAGRPATMNEGKVAWKSWNAILDGPFGEYNRIMRLFYEDHRLRLSPSSFRSSLRSFAR